MQRRRTLIAAPLLVAALCTAIPAIALQESQPKPSTHEFQITLILARPGELSLPEDLPGDALNALDDVLRILPYKAFEVIDSGWVRTQQSARVRLGEAGRYEALLQIRPPQGNSGELLVSHFEVDMRDFKRDEEGRVYYGDPVELLATSFNIDIGETVVVGTSRLNGEDEALIVLLKAVK